jgi:alkylation response protein AidB-like acyl-CoA dehydrogenase
MAASTEVTESATRYDCTRGGAGLAWIPLVAMTDRSGPIERAASIADEVLFPNAMATEEEGAVRVASLDRIAEAGLYGLAGPEDAGGEGAGLATLCSVTEMLAAGCLATTSVWVQHHSLVRALTALGPVPVREEWLGPLCRGERRAGVALAGLLPGTPRLTARPVRGAWILDGSSPWVTGWGRIDALHVAARGPGGDIVWLLVDARERTGLEAERRRLVAVRQQLVAVDASATVRLDFAGLEVPEERVIAVQEAVDLAAMMLAPLRINGSLALGVVRRCCRLIGPSSLDDALEACRRALDDAGIDDIAEARASACELALRAGAALMVREGSDSVTLDRHAQRLAREALFLLVFGTRPLIRAALLERLGGHRAGP